MTVPLLPGRELGLANQKHIPGPTPELRLVCVPDFRAKAKLIAELIDLFRPLVAQLQSCKTKCR